MRTFSFATLLVLATLACHATVQECPQTGPDAQVAAKPRSCPKDASKGNVDAAFDQAAPGGYAAVCGHLAQLGCPEGQDPGCVAVLTAVQGGRIEDLNPGCLLAAGSVSAAQACGSVACLAQ